MRDAHISRRKTLGTMNGRREENSENNLDTPTNGRGKEDNGGATTEMKILPIWTLGDPHKPSRHRSVTTSSSFMVVSRFLTRRHSILRERFLPKHYLHHRRYELMASFHVRSEARALQMPCSLSWDARAAAAAAAAAWLGARAPECQGIPMRHEREPRTADS